MNLINSLVDRQIGGRRSCPLIDFAFNKLSLCGQYEFNDLNDVGAPPLAMAMNDGLLSVANDGGDMALVNSRDMTVRKTWRAHNNAIFDVKWRPSSDDHLGTASGDKSITIWDVNKVEKVYSYECAHNGSIKSIDFKDQNVVASGSRDGLIKIWDLRCGRGGSVIVIENAHLSHLPSYKSSPKVRSQKSSPLNSVTCVSFNSHNEYLYSSGANDGTIKLWDLRKCRRNKMNKTFPVPIKQLYLGSKKCSPSHGFTYITFASNNRLFASCSDHSIYGFCGDMSFPSVKCIGLQVNNFTRINTFRDNYLISGSVDGRAFIWPIHTNRCTSLMDMTPILPINVLPHSDEEVTAVLADNHSYSIYTCSDDQKVNKWSLFNTNVEKEKNNSSQEFVPNSDQLKMIEVKANNSIDMISHNNGQPLSSLTNWLERSGKQHMTPSNPAKRMRLTQSLPTNKSKENHSRHKSSKRQLFNNNRKISDYFTP
ncbi:denticleless protein homolog [Oppia nitens]|uniref:denticleless protein homolog n=1 Tax=Oppia nitens TaxID=1686743 RepID=UPI0023DA249C|nr:denticleless protein homolog [Oppia nitens]